MTSDRVERKLVAIVSADVAGYSRLMSIDQLGTVRRLTAFRSEVESIVVTHGGRVVDSPGDNILMEFPSATRAVEFAVAAQTRLRELNSGLEGPERMEFRMGLHLGEVLAEDGRIYGDGVNIAARLEALAEPGGVLLSKTVRDQVGLKERVGFVDRGMLSLKNITEPVHAFAVSTTGPTSSSGGTDGRVGEDRQRAAWIAVLPFDNLSGDPDQEYFADGITEDIITGLSAYRTLRVISRTSSFRFRGSDQPIPRIAEDLGVRFVLEGSVRQAAGRVRVNAQLIDAPDRHHVWAERYDAELTDIFDVQDRIARSIVIAIDPAIRVSEASSASRKRPENISAWDHFQRGTVEMARAKRDANLEARSHFTKAIELDPGYAGGYSGAAWTYFWEALLEWADDLTEALDRGYGYAKRAIELDPLDASSYAALGGINLWMRRLDAAQSSAERAIELNPSLAHGYVMLAAAVKYAGDPGRGIEMFTTALELSPHDPWANWFLGGRALGQFMLGEQERATADARAAIKMRYGYLLARIVLTASLAEMGDMDDAQSELQSLLVIHPSVDSGVLRNYPFTEATEVHRHRLIDGLVAAGLEA